MKKNINNIYNLPEKYIMKSWETIPNVMTAVSFRMLASQIYWTGLCKYTERFMGPFWNVIIAYAAMEQKRIKPLSLFESLDDYGKLIMANMLMTEKGMTSDILAFNEYFIQECNRIFADCLEPLDEHSGRGMADKAERQAKLMDLVVNGYPEAIEDIASEYGLHLETEGYCPVLETERFLLYQVLPTDEKIKIQVNGKPILIIPPYVLGPNILAFLPADKKSFVHAFANRGIPTYIRIVKDIDSNEAVQVMTGEHDVLDTRVFCEHLLVKHGKPVTLSGFCQGGFIATLNMLSGMLDGLADALVTCVAPIDGTRSHSLAEYMDSLPERFQDIFYAVKTLPNGNEVVDGKIMSFVYKLKSIDRESPLAAFHRDLKMFDNRDNGGKGKIDKTAAAISHWIIRDCRDLPLDITRLSFASYVVPIARDGTLPIKLFGRFLNFSHLKENKIPWLICISEKDDLVDRDAALAPVDYIDAEISIFPKGHVSIATSWADPDSSCALDKWFTSGDKRCRGPVRFHLDLETLANGRKGKHQGC